MEETNERTSLLNRSNGSSTSTNGNQSLDVVTVKTTYARFYILAVFSFLGILQGMVWNTFGPVSQTVLAVFCPTWTASTLALLGNWGNIMYIIPLIPVMWFFEAKGLRPAMIFTGTLMFVGTLVRAIPAGVTFFTVMCHICAILNGIAGIVVFSAPSAVSAAWFPPEERTTATGVAIVFNNLGNAVSFIGGPALVPAPDKQENGTLDCPTFNQTDIDVMQTGIDNLMYSEFGMVALCFIMILAYFPSKPKNPPSISAAEERSDFITGMGAIVCNKNALLMTLSFSLFNGLIASWYSVMNITFASLPIADDPMEKDEIIGYIGLWAIVGNSVASILVSRLVDGIRGKMKVTLIVLMALGVVCWFWLCLLCLRVIPFSLPQLYASTILASALTYSSGPIFFELTVEVVYPVPEGVVGGFLTCVYNTIGMLFLFLFYIPQLNNNSTWIPYAIMGSTATAFPLLLLVKEEYHRSELDVTLNSNSENREGQQLSYA